MPRCDGALPGLAGQLQGDRIPAFAGMTSYAKVSFCGNDECDGGHRGPRCYGQREAARSGARASAADCTTAATGAWPSNAGLSARLRIRSAAGQRLG